MSATMRFSEDPMRKAVDLSGGVMKFAKKLGVGRTAVHTWLTYEAAPRLETADDIEIMTNGKVTIQDIAKKFKEVKGKK